MYTSFRCADYMYSYVRGAPPLLDMHRHKYYEFLYFISGEASYIVEGRIYKAYPGDIFVTAPGEEHCITFSSGSEYCRHFVQISPELMSQIPAELTAALREDMCFKKNRVPAELTSKYDLGAYFRRIRERIENKTPASDFMTRTLLKQLTVEISAIPPEEIISARSEMRLITSVKDFINEHVNDDIPLEIIAGHFYVSKYYLCHTFRRETGMTVKDYINIRRVTSAQEMINGGMAAGEVFARCGFSDYSTFYRAFKKYAGKTPSEYKKEKRSKETE